VLTNYKEILDSIIIQHLLAQNFPISVPVVHTSVDGSTWPGLVVCGVYDLGHQYRVDVAITNKAMVSYLRNRAVSDFEGYIADSRAIHDEDFG